MAEELALDRLLDAVRAGESPGPGGPRRTCGRVALENPQPTLLLRNYATCRGAWGATKGAGHDGHQLSADSLKAAGAGAAETCRFCGGLINQSYQDVHNRSHGYLPKASA